MEIGPSGKPIITLKQFELLRSVGKGAFGKVRIVKHKKSKELYALKYINKEKCIRQGAVKNTFLERDMLEAIEHPLIVNLRYSFQDDENMFMVLDLMLGGDLKFLLRKCGRMPEEWVQFYCAELIVSLDYLHKQGIVHRDIKPDNLLLDEKGHIHLTDFNVAAYLPEDREKLNSFAGTVSYMAPEVLKRAGYREEVDWWSVAVVAFELLFGKRPFRASSGKEVMYKIVHSQYRFPSNSSRDISSECTDFISKCLELDVSKRLGCGANGVDDLKSHPWFASFKWREVEALGVSPPFTPNMKAGNFSAIHEAEDILLEDKPLKPNKRKSLMPPQDPEMLRIHELFPDYDFTWKISDEEKAKRVKDVAERSKALEGELSKKEIDEDELEKHDEEPLERTLEEPGESDDD